MSLYKIADLTAELECAGKTLLKRRKPYRTDTEGPADITIHIGGKTLKKAGVKYPQLSPDELEYILTGFAFSRALLDYDGFCLHASAVAMDHRAVLFSAPCGTGKSTHANLWRQHFGWDKAVVVNDDKPALRLMEDAFFAYGTPWSGKSELNTNIKVPLHAVVFLEQAEENHIRRLDNKEAVRMLFYQSLRPNGDSNKMSRLLALLDALLKKTAVYQMGCTVSIDAVKLAYDTINNVAKG